jgi:hypothetical protein
MAMVSRSFTLGLRRVFELRVNLLLKASRLHNNLRASATFLTHGCLQSHGGSFFQKKATGGSWLFFIGAFWVDLAEEPLLISKLRWRRGKER